MLLDLSKSEIENTVGALGNTMRFLFKCIKYLLTGFLYLKKCFQGCELDIIYNYILSLFLKDFNPSVPMNTCYLTGTHLLLDEANAQEGAV